MTAPLSPRTRQLLQLAVTGALLVAAAYGARALWTRSEGDPWTRDGRVRADIVQVAPDVAGLVAHVFVANDQPVKRGDPLFQIDRERYDLALRQAQGAVAMQQAALREAAAAKQTLQGVPAVAYDEWDADMIQGCVCDAG